MIQLRKKLRYVALALFVLVLGILDINDSSETANADVAADGGGGVDGNCGGGADAGCSACDICGCNI
jgi:hypothetical protein